MTGTETSLIVEIVEIVAIEIESRDNEERRANSETLLKIATNKEVDHREGTLTVTLETTAGFVAIITPVRISPVKRTLIQKLKFVEQNGVEDARI